jgi:hypothetical protein
MKIRTRWSWIAALIAASAMLSPLGLYILHSAFFAGEQFSRNIWGVIAWTGIAILVTIALLEWIVRTLILKRRARCTTTA